ncbi:MAG: ASCH domain-containing protein [Planctomycetota bacterium]
MSEHDLTPEALDYFEDFLKGAPSLGFDPQAMRARRVVLDRFGDSAEMTEELTRLVLEGTKTASCTCRWEWEADGDEPLGVGTLAVITDHDGKPRCIVETTSLEDVPFREVGEAHAHAEGEGDRTLAYWRRVHWEWFKRHLARIGREPSEEMPILCERFRVLWR